MYDQFFDLISLIQLAQTNAINGKTMLIYVGFGTHSSQAGGLGGRAPQGGHQILGGLWHPKR